MTVAETRPATAEDDAGGMRERKASRRAQVSIAGREPRVDLLPPEVHADRRERGVARRAWLGVIVVAAVAALAVGAAAVHQLDTASSLTAAQAETTSLLQQQQRFSEVRQAEQDSQVLEAARAVGGSTEIDWNGTLSQLKALLPSGVAITSMTIDSADVTTPFAQSAVPLEKARVATMQLTVSSPTIPSVPDWTARLSQLDGYADSSITAVALQEDSGGYSATVQVHLGAGAFDGKYTEEQSK